MASVTATVVQQNDEHVTVSAMRQSTCSHCRKQAHCGFFALENLNNPPVEFELPHTDRTQTDIQIDCDDRALLAYISTLFLPSLICITITLALLHYFGFQDFLQSIGLVTSTGVGFFISKRLLKRKADVLRESIRVRGVDLLDVRRKM